MGQLLGIGPVKRFTEFAAVDLRFWTDKLLDLFRIVVPSLQMPSAELTLRVFLITGTLPMFANFYLRDHWCALFSD